MAEDQSDRAGTVSNINETGEGKRTPRAIRFSDSEWKRIKTAATARGISIGGFIRDAALARSQETLDARPASPSPAIEELIKHTFRYAFILSSIKRDELIADGHKQTVDDAVKRARAAQDEVLSVPPNHPSPR